MANIPPQAPISRSQSAPTPATDSSSQLSFIQSLSDQLYDTLYRCLEKHQQVRTHGNGGDNHANANGSNVNANGDTNGGDPQDDDFQRAKNDLEYLKDLFMKIDNLSTTQFRKYEDHAKGQIKDIRNQIDKILKKNATSHGQYEALCKSIKELKEKREGLEEKQKSSDTKNLIDSELRRASGRRSGVNESSIEAKTKSLKESSAFHEFEEKYARLGDEETKRCLFWFSVFPEGVRIKKRAMVYVWFAEGLIAVPEKSTLENAGNEKFAKFFELGILEPVIENGKVYDSIKMQSHIRNLVIALATRDGCFRFDGDGYLIPSSDPPKHQTFLLNKPFSLKDLKDSTDADLEKIETLFNVDEEKLIIKPDRFSKMKQAKVVYLGRWSVDGKDHIEVESADLFSVGLRNMPNLKLLSLQGVSRITEIPSSISKCKSLEILDLRACHNLEKIDKQIGLLKALTHLDLTDCHLLEDLPKQITSLSALQVLKGFVIVEHKKHKKFCEFGDLSKLKNLRKLKISAKDMSFPTNEHLKTFQNLSQLRKLIIEWGGSSGKDDDKEASDKPSRKPGGTANAGLPVELEKLDLRSVPRRPAELLLNPENLKKLKKLYIRGGELHSIDHQGRRKWKEVERLEIIRLKFLNKLDMNWREFRSLFPGARYLEIVKCPKLAFFPCSNKKGFWAKSN